MSAPSRSAAPSLGGRIRAGVAVARLAARSLWFYRAGMVISVIVLLLQIFALQIVWTAVYADRSAVAGSGGVGDISIEQQLAYVSVSVVQFAVFNAWSAYSLRQRVREGRIGTDLARPLGLLWQVAMTRVGTIAASLPFAVLVLVLATTFGDIAVPAGLAALAGYLVALVLATVIAIQLAVLVDMTSFWTLEVTGIELSYTLVSRLLSGSLVPLWFMPEWLRLAAGVLPFQATTFTPVAIYLGILTGPEMWRALAVSAGWVLVLAVVLRLCWNRVLRRVVVQGG